MLYGLFFLKIIFLSKQIYRNFQKICIMLRPIYHIFYCRQLIDCCLYCSKKQIKFQKKNSNSLIVYIYFFYCKRYNNYVFSMKGALITLLSLNCIMFGLHIIENCHHIKYFCQLTIIGQILVIFNFIASIVFNERKSNIRVKILLSRLHLVTLGLQVVICVGYWAVRFSLGQENVGGNFENRYQQILSMWVHLGCFLTMLIFVKFGQVVSETRKRKKLLMHLIWGFPFMIIQVIHWYFIQQHLYGFIANLSWPILITFQTTLLGIAVFSDTVFERFQGIKLHPKEQDHYEKLGHNIVFI